MHGKIRYRHTRNMLLLLLLVPLCAQWSSAQGAQPTPALAVVANCTNVGVTCDPSSSAVGNCSAKPGGGFLWTEVERCSPMQSCNATSASCAKATTSNAITRHLCGTEGTFPDLTNCKSHFICIAAGADPVFASPEAECGKYSAYDACTKDCDKLLTNNVCPSKLLCTSTTLIQVVEENQRIWYFCMPDGSGGFYVQMNECTSGFFNTITNTCSNDASNACTPTNPNIPTCTTPGFMADPYDCTAYYYCDSNLQATHVNCVSGYYYSSAVQGCIRGTCN